MSEQHLSRRPHAARGTSSIWWYEEPYGIAIYVQDTSGHVKKGIVQWRALRAAIERMDKKP